MTGEQIQEAEIIDIINQPDFHTLRTVRVDPQDGTFQEYWEVTFESETRLPDGLYQYNNSKSPYKLFRFFKPKIKL